MPRRPSPIKHRCPHATQRTRSPSDFQSEPIVVWRSNSSARDSLAVRGFGVPGAGEMFALSLREPLAGTAAFMILSVRQWIKFACARAVVKTGPIQESVAADVRRLWSIGFLFQVSLLPRPLPF